MTAPLRLITVSILSALTVTIARAEPVPETVAPPRTCELHVWPGGDLRSTYSGWFHGGIVDGAVQGREGYRKLPEKPLASAAQLAALKQLDLAGLVGTPAYALVWHDTALESRALRTTPGRLLPGTPPCYAELAVDNVFFQEDVFSGRSLNVIIRFRRFDGEGPPVQSFGAVLAQKLVLFPPAPSATDTGPAFEELITQFRAAVVRFGTSVQAPPKAKIRH